MIDAVAAIVFLWLFSIWKRNDWFNATLKFFMLALGLALAFQALQQFGYIINI